MVAGSIQPWPSPALPAWRLSPAHSSHPAGPHPGPLRHLGPLSPLRVLSGANEESGQTPWPPPPPTPTLPPSVRSSQSCNSQSWFSKDVLKTGCWGGGWGEVSEWSGNHSRPRKGWLLEVLRGPNRGSSQMGPPLSVPLGRWPQRTFRDWFSGNICLKA